MSGKLLWTGLFLLVAMPVLVGAAGWPAAPWALVGAVVMALGLVLMWLDK